MQLFNILLQWKTTTDDFIQSKFKCNMMKTKQQMNFVSFLNQNKTFSIRKRKSCHHFFHQFGAIENARASKIFSIKLMSTLKWMLKIPSHIQKLFDALQTVSISDKLRRRFEKT